MTDNTLLENVQKLKSLNLESSFFDNENSDNIGNHCQYYSESDFLEKIKTIDYNHFSTLSLNIRSLPGNWLEFQNFLKASFGTFNPTVICLQEIWSKPCFESFSLPDYHPFHFKIRDPSGINRNSGGGVGLWVIKSVSFEPVNQLSIFIPRVFESQFIKIKTDKNKYTLVGNIYRPNTAPFADIKKFNQTLSEILFILKNNSEFKNAQDIILLGDVNINLLNHASHSDTGIYLDTLLENGLLPLVSLPTRISNNSATLIDHISTNINDKNLDTSIIVSDVSDHFAVFFLRPLKNCKKEVLPPKKVRVTNERAKQKFITLLENQSWENVTSNFDPISSFKTFFDTIDKCFEESFPEKTVPVRNKSKQNAPWMTSGLHTSRKHKLKLYSKKLRNPTAVNVLKFKEFNSIYTRLTRVSRQKYYDEKFLECSNDCKKTWQTINEVLGKRKSFSDIPNEFESNDKVLSGSLSIANGFNDFFSTIGPNLAKKITKSKNHYSKFLSNPCSEQFVFGNVTPTIIEDALRKLKSKNSAGPDKVSSSLLKFMAGTIMNPLCHIFNLSFKTGYIPSCLKTALVKPIFKKGATNQFTNYRPISLLSSFSKLLEKIAANQIMKYLNKFKLLYEHQYGFRAGHSTIQPVIQFLDKVYNAMNNDKFTLSVFIDLTKAFDTCDTDILLEKLKYYGFRGISNYWFRNYLTGRMQYTSVNNVNSSLNELKCGVPQGSVLGPILFLLLINDLPNATNMFSILFADDTTLQLSSSNIVSLYEQANVELDKLADWFKANKLTLNISKTKYMIFKDKSKTVNFASHNLKIDNEVIERIGKNCPEESFKFVGINLDECLSWRHHVNHVINKIAGATYALSKLKNLLPNKIKLTIYNSLFKSHIEYGIVAWGNSADPGIKRICSLQKRSVRYISNARSKQHTSNLFAEHKILKFHDLVKHCELSFMYKYVYSILPSSFNDMFVKLNSFDRSLSFQMEVVKKSFMKTLPAYTLPKNWNNLPLELKRIKSLNVFKNSNKEKILSSYNFSCTANNCYSCQS